MKHYLALHRSSTDERPFASFETFFQPARSSFLDFGRKCYRVIGDPWFVIREFEAVCCVQVKEIKR